MIETMFIISLIMIGYTYVGYPLVIGLISRLSPQITRKSYIQPNVSIVIAAYNEEKNITQKIENCLSLNYPKDKIEIIIGSDCSTDKTDEIVLNYNKCGVKLYRLRERQGKIAVINDIILQTKGEIIVFSDARQKFHVDAINELVKNFADEEVGCVSGELILENNKKIRNVKGIGLYWDYEKIIRKWESKWFSMIGATGAIYAMRKELYVPPETDIILDDVFIPIKVIEQGFRVIMEPNALAYDEISQSIEEESTRKIRTLSGNWQLLIRLLFNLHKFKIGFIFMFLSHKVARLLMPFSLVLLFISNVLIIKKSVYIVTFVVQCILYSLALMKILLKRTENQMMNIPYTFCVMNLNVLIGLYNYLLKKQKVTWR